MLNRKHNLKSGKSKAKKKELETKKGRKLKKREMISEEKTCNLIFGYCSFHERKAKKKEKERKKETKTRNQNKAKTKTRRKKERKEEKKDRERETEKEGGPKGLREKERETLKINKKCPFLGGKQGFFCIKQPKNKTKKKPNKKTTKTNKEGLGPSEVALWATSPDP